MSTMTVTSTINRKYLKNKTKDEIIDLLLYILDTRCEADAKIEKQAAEIERLKEVGSDMDKQYTRELLWQAAEIERLKAAIAEALAHDNHSQ